VTAATHVTRKLIRTWRQGRAALEAEVAALREIVARVDGAAR